MKATIIYKPNSEHASEVEEYMREYNRRTGRELETIDPDSVEGADICRLYDIVEYPSVIALSDDGRLQNTWRGLPLPTMNELSYYA